MANDGTRTINPSGKTMYLILSGRRSSGVPRVQLKVESIKQASEEMQDWIKKTGIWKGDVNTSHVYVGGMTVAKVAFDGKVYRVDPFTKEIYGHDKADRVLYDPAAYEEEVKKEREKREQRDRLINLATEAKFAFVKHVYVTVYEQVKDMPDLQESRTELDAQLLAVNRTYVPGQLSDPPSSFRLCLRRGNNVRVDVVMAIHYYYEERVQFEFSPSVANLTQNNTLNDAPITDMIEVLQNAKTVFNTIRDAIKSEAGKTLLETYMTARKALAH